MCYIYYYFCFTNSFSHSILFKFCSVNYYIKYKTLILVFNVFFYFYSFLHLMALLGYTSTFLEFVCLSVFFFLSSEFDYLSVTLFPYFFNNTTLLRGVCSCSRKVYTIFSLFWCSEPPQFWQAIWIFSQLRRGNKYRVADPALGIRIRNSKLLLLP